MDISMSSLLTKQFPEYIIVEKWSRASGFDYQLCLNVEKSFMFWKYKSLRVIYNLPYDSKTKVLITNDYDLATKLENFGHRVFFCGRLP